MLLRAQGNRNNFMNDKAKKTILLVEDESVTAMYQKNILEKYGYKVITINTGEKAIEILREGN
jgi:CheY-like chemotaxis protein